MLTTMLVSSPGFRLCLTADAVVQTPQETRMLWMVTVFLVLLTRWNGCDSVGPRGTEPKSLDTSSNSESAQEAAAAGPAVDRPRRITMLVRNMEPFPAAIDPAACRMRLVRD